MNKAGRPRNEAGHIYKVIGVSGTPAEIAAVVDRLTPRQRLEAMLAAIRNGKPDDGKDAEVQRMRRLHFLLDE